MVGLWGDGVFECDAVLWSGLWMKLDVTGKNNSTLVRKWKIGIGGVGHWKDV